MLTFILIYSILQTVYSNPHVQIQQGTLKGSVLKTYKGTTFFGFQGIPYGEPPVGLRRFQVPLPAKPWKGVLDATRLHAACPQVPIFAYSGTTPQSEDCLFLNVYTPNTTALLPVVAFIHGGGFMCDDSNIDMYGPHILLDKELVLVTFNYRLGAFGFLSLEDDVILGNNGLKDQNLALQWIRDNIRNFGGDSRSVTIFGSSAGGASVHFHMLSSLSRGLFHRAISSSGISTAGWTLARKGEANRYARRLAEALECPTSSSSKILTCLQALQFSDINKQICKIMESDYKYHMMSRPVIEPNIPGSFISDHPADIIRSKQFSDVPYMIGVTTNDGALFSADIYNNNTILETLSKDFENLAPLIFYYNNLDDQRAISRKIKNFYLQDKPIDNNTKLELTEMATDAFFYYPERITAELHARYSVQPVYFYLFGFKGSFTYLSEYGDTSFDYGVVHCDDLTYLISDESFSTHNLTETDLEMREVMTTLIENFARTGDPTPQLDGLITKKWKPVGESKFKYYSIMGPTDLKTKSTLYEERYNFWKSLPVFPEINKAENPT